MVFALKPGDLVIDCYHGDGDPDFKQIAAAGYKGVFLKASQGLRGYVDWIARNSAAALAQGMPVGAYHFVDPDGDPSDQVDAFWTATECADFSLGMMLDIEQCFKAGQDAWENKHGNAPSQYVRELVENLRAWGFEHPGIYSGPSFWQDKICNPSDATEDLARIAALKGCWTMVARYPTLPDQLESFDGEHPYFHQFTESGRVQGFSGGCDVSRVIEVPSFARAD